MVPGPERTLMEFANSDSTQSPSRLCGRFVGEGVGVRLGVGVSVRVGESVNVGVDVSASLVDVAVGMTVSVAHQREGLGRIALEDAAMVAAAWPANAIRLDAWDADAGAGRFYERCGYQQRGRVVYRGSPLVYLERLV